MRYNFAPSYRRGLKGIADPRRLAGVDQALGALAECLELGVRPPAGLGLKILRPPLWEFRSSLSDRVLFTWEGDLVTFVAVGTHDDIRRFLKSH